MWLTNNLSLISSSFNCAVFKYSYLVTTHTWHSMWSAFAASISHTKTNMKCCLPILPEVALHLLLELSLPKKNRQLWLADAFKNSYKKIYL